MPPLGKLGKQPEVHMHWCGQLVITSLIREVTATVRQRWCVVIVICNNKHHINPKVDNDEIDEEKERQVG